MSLYERTKTAIRTDAEIAAEFNERHNSALTIKQVANIRNKAQKKLMALLLADPDVLAIIGERRCEVRKPACT